MLAPGEETLVTEAFFNEQNHEKLNQETHSTQKESPLFTTEIFPYFHPLLWMVGLDDLVGPFQPCDYMIPNTVVCQKSLLTHCSWLHYKLSF